MKISDILYGLLFVVSGLTLVLGGNWILDSFESLTNEKTSLQKQVTTLQDTNNNLRGYVIALESELPNFGDSARYGTERDNQKIINEELGGQMEVVLDCGSRVDLVFELEDQKSFNMVACEVDWAKKWAEGIGQSIYYWLKLNDPIIRSVKEQGVPLNPRTLHRPLVILLAKGKDSGWEKYRDRVEFVGKYLPRPGLTCWVFDAETKTWLDKRD